MSGGADRGGSSRPPGTMNRMSEDLAPRLHYTGHLIRRAQQLHVALWNEHVSIETSSVQFAAMRVIDGSPGMSQAELGSELGLDRSTIADLVERMARNGLLARERSIADRRRMVLTLTPQGSERLTGLTPQVEHANELLTAGLDEAEHEQLRVLLRKMLAHGTAAGHLKT